VWTAVGKGTRAISWPERARSHRKLRESQLRGLFLNREVRTRTRTSECLRQRRARARSGRSSSAAVGRARTIAIPCEGGRESTGGTDVWSSSITKARVKSPRTPPSGESERPREARNRWHRHERRAQFRGALGVRATDRPTRCARRAEARVVEVAHEHGVRVGPQVTGHGAASRASLERSRRSRVIAVEIDPDRRRARLQAEHGFQADAARIPVRRHLAAGDRKLLPCRTFLGGRSSCHAV
jgi:hypothetical protein